MTRGGAKQRGTRRSAKASVTSHVSSDLQPAHQPAVESSEGEIEEEKEKVTSSRRSFELEAIVGDAKIEGEQHFEIQWKGLGIEHNSWRTKDEMEIEYPETLAKYLRALENNRANVSKFNRLFQYAKGQSISVLNTVDDVDCPEDFTYINHNIYSDEVPRPCTPMFWCECTNGCHEGCECASERNYNIDGRLISVGKGRIVECGPLCKCGDECINRVVQNGSKVELELRRYLHKGWGVVTKSPLKKGTFVAEYVGEVITTDEAERRGFKDKPQGLTYLYDLDNEFFASDCSDFSIDAKTHGNISRFFNHSCNPNMNTHSIYIEHRDPRLHRLAIFATRYIRIGEELTIDYSPGAVEGESVKTDPCHCGATNCRKFMFF
ncbi:hypothetical protein GGI09_008275 [Coemansia sp. S100]|nr:hypothetical protein LPJ71_001378 [Coemansia sp. S17]KAJ2077114.1 hypothetical protein GGI09_008275 [Coemansia sp. S100]KAJ2099670.1 hypothetical protein GGI16_003933 [Coemansia sp. S142-1]